MTERPCPRCGASAPEGAHFCENCGATLDTDRQPNAAVKRSGAALDRASASWGRLSRVNRLTLVLAAVMLAALVATEGLGVSWHTGVLTPLDAAKGKTPLVMLATALGEQECGENRGQIWEAISAYQEGNAETPFSGDIDALIPQYLSAMPKCPSGGKYAATPDGSVSCSKHSYEWEGE